MQVFELSALHGHLDYSLLECVLLVEDLLKLRARFGAYFLLALRALKVVEYDTRTIPLLLHLRLDAIEVHHVTAVEATRRFLT